jgi:hypothetical protein
MNPLSSPSEGITAPAAPRKRRWRVWVIALILVAGLIAFAPVQALRWTGGFSEAGYQVTFLRPDGRPVEGVRLRVVTKNGGTSYLYPVTDFLPDSIPTSDVSGKMVFHHVHFGIEFDGTDYYSLIGVPLRQDGVPKYECRFLIGDREVSRLSFDDLRLRSRQAPPVTRVWHYSDWPSREYLAHVDDWDRRERELFDGNGDGRWDLEELIPHRLFLNEAESSLIPGHQGRQPREITFAVRERTVVIDMP